MRAHQPPAGDASPVLTVTLARPLPPATLWERLWDLDRHTAAVPLTTAHTVGADTMGPGARFLALTSLGPFHFDDRMVVREWQAPQRAVIEKVGPLLEGRIEVTLTASGRGTVVHWRQSYGARGVPARLAAVARPVLAAGYRRTLARILDDEGVRTGAPPLS